jgi:hypothetical protein
MTIPTNADCPLCAEQASFEQMDRSRKHFKCSSCFEFVILREAESALRTSANTAKDKLATEAKATTDPEHIYVIAANLPDSHPDVHLTGRVLRRSVVWAHG